MPPAPTPLTRFAARLCDYAAGNVSGAFLAGRSGKTYAEQVRKTVTPALWEYLSEETADHLANVRILTDDEFEQLAEAASLRSLLWCPNRHLHLDATLLVPVIAATLTRETANDWAGYCRHAKGLLEQPNLLASEGILLVSGWVDNIQTLMRALEIASAIPSTEDTRLDRIQESLDRFETRSTVRDYYSTDEFASVVGKAEFTVREWCRLGRIHAEKRTSGRGRHLAWTISHAELIRYQREGLLALDH